MTEFDHPAPSLPALRRPIHLCTWCSAEIPPGQERDHWRACQNHPARVEVERLRRCLDAVAGAIKTIFGSGESECCECFSCTTLRAALAEIEKMRVP